MNPLERTTPHTPHPSPRILGMMSGTSADGVDLVLLELEGFPRLGQGGKIPPALQGSAPRGTILAQHYHPYSRELKDRVLAAMRNQLDTFALAQLHFELGECYARAALELSPHADLIANHGQTVCHIPRLDAARGWNQRATWQLGEAAVIAARTSLDVISDFRPSDLALGGEAAPLVPFADWLRFAEAGKRRAIHNLGGISNLTYLHSLEPSRVVAFDTGPGMALCDEVANILGLPFDDGGALARNGTVDTALLERWLSDPYFQLEPPKSTGREYWNLQNLSGWQHLEPADLAATVTALTCQSVARAYERWIIPKGLDEIWLAGGGSFNTFLLEGLRNRLNIPIQTFEELGQSSSAREAAAFAVLGYYAYQGWPNVLAHSTGATRAAIAGKLTRA